MKSKSSKIVFTKPKKVETRLVLDEYSTKDIVINLDNVCAFYWFKNDYTKVILNNGTYTIECSYFEFSRVFDEYIACC